MSSSDYSLQTLLPVTQTSRSTITKTEYAFIGYLARLRSANTQRIYRYQLLKFTEWCGQHGLPALDAKRVHIDLYLREVKDTRLAEATVAMRFMVVRGFFRYAVEEELVDRDPTLRMTPPEVDRAKQYRPFLTPLEYAALLSVARQSSPCDHAAVAIFGMMGLRLAEALSLMIDSISYDRGYELITFVGKGNKQATMPMPIPVLRAVHAAIDHRAAGPILTADNGVDPLSPSGARRMLRRLCRRAGVPNSPPHALRRTFCTSGLLAGVPIDLMQHSMRHADQRMTNIYNMAKDNLDRHATHRVAAYLSGMTNN